MTVPYGRDARFGSKRYMVAAHREPLNVRFAPEATELLRRREMSRGASSSREHVQ